MSRFDSGLKGLKEKAGKAAPAEEPAKAQPAEASTDDAEPRVPSRQGKVAIAAYFDPAVRKQLALLAVMEDKSQSAMLAEALNMLFERYGKPPIANA